MKWSVKSKQNLKNIELLDVNKFILNFSLKDIIPQEGDPLYVHCFEVLTKQSPTTMKLKEELVKLQNEYDTSEFVNSFTINGISSWLDRNTRVALRNAINVVEASDGTTYDVWIGTSPISLPIEIIRDFLDQLELYAINAYNVTQAHIVLIYNINNRDDLFKFDISAGYPQKININI